MIQDFHELIEQARKLGPARIAVIEAHDPDVLESLAQAEPLGLVEAILVGNPGKIEAAANKVGYKLRPETLVSTPGEDVLDSAIDRSGERR